MVINLINVDISNNFDHVIILKLIADKLLSKLRKTNLGNELSFVIGVHFETKTSLEIIAFYLKLNTSLLPTFNGGINDILLPLKKVFKIDQYVLEFADGSINF